MKPARKGALLSLGAASGAALFFLPYKQASLMVERDVVIMVTMLVAGLLNTATALIGGVRALRVDRTTLVVSLLLALLTISGNMGTAQALVRVGAGVTSILQQTQILFVAVIGFFALGERVSLRFVIGMAVVLAGLVIMQAPSAASGADLAGILWGLVSSLSFALMHVLTRKVIERIQPVTVNALRLWLVVAILLCVPGNAGVLLALDRDIWLLCAAAAFVGPFLGRICLMFALRHITASHSVLITLVTPVFAFVLDFLVLGAQPTPWQIAGSLVIMVGVSIPVLELVSGQRVRPYEEAA